MSLLLVGMRSSSLLLFLFFFTVPQSFDEILHYDIEIYI
ncbi:hypothetical protein BSSX_4295 [Bacillus subtilis]|nr:hypothetical protein BSSX_4295 [Bacillus subtilis]